jgi:predicted outer membrane repeat protein
VARSNPERRVRGNGRERRDHSIPLAAEDPMLAPPLRRARQMLSLVPTLLFLPGCSDPAAPAAPRIAARPHALEAPVITVTNTDDSGPGSLRQAIFDASATPGTLIHFDPTIAGQTIVVTSQLKIGTEVTIEGPVPQGLTISGGLSTQVFEVGGPANLVMRNVSIVNGRSVVGAGMLIRDGQVALDHVLVANNEASSAGGGIRVDGGGALTLVNSTLSGNVAGTDGGAISAGDAVVMRNSTIAFNVAGDGGGLFMGLGSLSMRNTIIANNIDSDDTNGNIPNCYAKVAAPALSGRNMANENPCFDDPAIVVADPQLRQLAANGGPTMTHALGAQSAAIDLGTSCTETTDQRYVPRDQGASCDIGAFEFNDYGQYTITLGPNVPVNARTGVITLTGTVSCSKPTAQLGLNVAVSQTQKTTGRFTTIIQQSGFVGFTLCGPSPTSWSVSLTPATGKFEPGSATGSASTGVYATNFLPATVTSTLKVFQVK